MAKGNAPWFDFTTAPPLGLRVRYRKQFITLIGIETYRRKDGADSHILHWRSDAGQEGTTGLRANAWTQKRQPDLPQT